MKCISDAMDSINIEIKNYADLASNSYLKPNLKERKELLDKVDQIWNRTSFITQGALSSLESGAKLTELAEQVKQINNVVQENNKKKPEQASFFDRISRAVVKAFHYITGTQPLEKKIAQREEQLLAKITDTAKAVDIYSKAVQSFNLWSDEASRNKSWAHLAVEHLSSSEEFAGSRSYLALENTLELFKEMEAKHAKHPNLFSLKEEIKNAAEYGKLFSVLEVENIGSENKENISFLKKELATEISNKVQSLSQGDGFSLPIGLKNHAIMLRITKEANNKFNFKLYNEGRGVDLHGSAIKDASGKSKREVVYEIPNVGKEKISSELFQEVIDQLLEGTDENKLYKKILPNLGKQRRTHPNTDPTRWSHLQLGGSCASQSVKAMIKDVLGVEGIEEYQSYKKNIRLHVAQKVSDIAKKTNVSSGKKALLKEILSKLEKTGPIEDSEKRKIENLRQEIQDIELKEKLRKSKELEKFANLYLNNPEAMMKEIKNRITGIFEDNLKSYFSSRFKLTEDQEEELEDIVSEIKLDNSDFKVDEEFKKLYKDPNLSQDKLEEYLLNKMSQVKLSDKGIFPPKWLSSLQLSSDNNESLDLNNKEDINTLWSDIQKVLPEINPTAHVNQARSMMWGINQIRKHDSLERAIFTESQVNPNDPNGDGYLSLNIALLFMQKFMKGQQSHNQCKEALSDLSGVDWDMKQLDFEKVEKALAPIVGSFLKTQGQPDVEALMLPNIDLFAGLAQILYKNNMHEKSDSLKAFCKQAQSFYLQLNVAEKFQDSPWRNEIKLMFEGNIQEKFH